MATYTCPKGHSSTENDYCSECGAKIDGVSKSEAVLLSNPVPQAAPPAVAPAGTVTCPDCSVAHGMSAGDYCEVCGYNFKTGAHGELALAPTPAPASVAPPPPPPPPAVAPTPVPTPPPVEAAAPTPEGKPLGWEVSVTVDPSLKTEGSPDAPADFEPIVAALRAGSNLVGRTSPRRGIHPEVALDQDDAVSHRHALFEVHTDGTLTVRDIGSSNGTSVNGKEIAQLTDVAVNDGDQITLGHWTRLLIKAVR